MSDQETRRDWRDVLRCRGDAADGHRPGEAVAVCEAAAELAQGNSAWLQAIKAGHRCRRDPPVRDS